MEIWFTEIGEPLPLEANVRLHRYGMLTKELAAIGHDVVWWTSSFSHAPKEFIRHADCEETVNGVTLRIIHGPGYKRNISIQRIRHQAHFARRFSEIAPRYKYPDLIISPVPTLDTAEAAVKLGKEQSIPVLTDIRDEWPEEFVNLAPLPFRPLARLILNRAFQRISYICRNATGIMAMSRRQFEYGLKYANRPQGPYDGVFPHGYYPEPEDPDSVRSARQWWFYQGVREDAFVCCFFGTFGRFFNLSTVIESARTLSKELDIQFIMCGDGGSLARYKKEASDVPSVLFPGWVDAPKISALMHLSNVGLAPYRANTTMSLPNKPIEYFAGGLPVVSSIRGELKDILSRHQCGRSYDPDSVEELCSILRELHGSQDKAVQMGRNARALLESEFTVQKIAERMAAHFEEVVRRSGSIAYDSDQ